MQKGSLPSCRVTELRPQVRTLLTNGAWSVHGSPSLHGTRLGGLGLSMASRGQPGGRPLLPQAPAPQFILGRPSPPAVFQNHPTEARAFLGIPWITQSSATVCLVACSVRSAVMSNVQLLPPRDMSFRGDRQVNY